MATQVEMDLRVGIIGATGAVGREIISVLEKRGFPCGSGGPVLFGSKGGKKVQTDKWGEQMTQAFTEEALTGFDVCFLAVSGDFATAHAANIAAKLNAGGIVVDNSSALRYLDGVPLVVPEVNGALCKGAKVVANPNCTTAIALMALYPLFVAFGLRKVIMSTYQAASGAGAEGMAELRQGITSQAPVEAGLIREDGCFTDAAKATKPEVFAHPLAFNVIPHIDKFQANGYTKEEMKVTWETRKMLGFDPFDENSAAPKVSCTAVRIPTLRAHSEAITIETERPVTAAAARAVLEKAVGIRVVDDVDNNLYPMPITATGSFDVEVGRIRANAVFGERGLDLFLCGDQLLRGAALNAVLIAEVSRAE